MRSLSCIIGAEEFPPEFIEGKREEDTVFAVFV
jgi:hypothetical protein